jgi:hypothetical protein
MGKKHNVFHGTFTKIKDKLIIQGDNSLYKLFISSLEEGQTVDVFFESNAESGTWNQLAKIHACIKELASEIGYTFDEMKSVVKERAGLFNLNDKNDPQIKSFKNCSKEELSMVIQTIIEIGDTVGINFR